MITVEDFLELALENYFNIEIFDTNSSDTVFEGSIDELEEYKDYSIQSWNPINNGICLNIDLDE